MLARTDVLFTSPHIIRHLFASGQLLLARLGARERTGPDIATWYIGAHHNASGRNLGANEPQRGWLGSLAKEATQKAAEAAKLAMEKAEEAAKKAAMSGKKAAQKAAEATRDAARKAAKATKEAADKALEAVKETARNVKDAVKK